MDRSPTEVWIESFRSHAYIRIGPKENLATVNDPRHAEAVRAALQKVIDPSFDPSANRGPLQCNKEK
jgi:hypothetical protein